MSNMKILLLDIETAPAEAYVWSLYDDGIPIQRLKKPGYTLSWAAKWYGKKKLMYNSLQKSSLEEMTEEIHGLLDEADVVIHYNGVRFDVPTLNKDFILNGLTPPSPYIQLDLYPVVKKNFKLPSYKLGYVTKAFGLGEKVEHGGFDLWVNCMEGNVKAWRDMIRYNKGDVTLTEALYDYIKPWIPNHPNHALFTKGAIPVCRTCGGNRLQQRGTRPSKTRLYKRYHCQDCGSWSSATIAEKIERGHVLTSA